MHVSKLSVHYGRHLNLEDWEQRNKIGEVPDRLPYGLDRIEEFCDTKVIPRQAGNIRARDVLKIIRNSHERAQPSAYLAAAWEEDSALRLPRDEPASMKACGVIWLTDRIASRSYLPKDILLRRVLRSFDLLWVLGRAQAPILQNWLGPSAPPIAFLPFGIDNSFFTYTSYPDRQRILSVGSDRDRDHQTLFQAMSLVHAARPDVEILVQSDAKAPTPDGVTRIDRVSHQELRGLYKTATATVVSTRPNVHVSGMTVALESLAVGRPVVITDTPGMSDYVRHEVDGFIVAPGDPVSMAERTIQLIDNSSYSADMGRRGSSRVAKAHTSQTMSQNLCGLIRDHL